MKQATVFLAMLCVVAAISGCAKKGENVEAEATDLPPTTSPTSSPTSSPTASPTSSPISTVTPTTITDPPPAAPIANLTADRTNGSIPVDVAFTIQDMGDGGAEQYNWTLEFGDGNSTNGTDVPAVVPYSYLEIGTYIVNLTLSNEIGESNASINITTTDFAAERFSGEWETGLVACMVGPQSEWTFSDYNETSHVEFAVNNTTWNMTFFAEFGEDASEYNVDFYDEDMALVENFESTDNSTVNGTVPQNATLVVFWACNEAGGGSVEYAAALQSEWDRQREAAPPEDE